MFMHCAQVHPSIHLSILPPLATISTSAYLPSPYLPSIYCKHIRMSTSKEVYNADISVCVCFFSHLPKAVQFHRGSADAPLPYL